MSHSPSYSRSLKIIKFILDFQKNTNVITTDKPFNQFLFALFFATVMTSYFVHLHFRKNHFQESDSTLVYYLFQDQPQNGFIYAGWNFAYGKIILSEKNVHKMIANEWRAQRIANEIITDEVDCRFEKDEIFFGKLGNPKKYDSTFNFLEMKSTTSLDTSAFVNQLNQIVIDKNFAFKTQSYIDSASIPSRFRKNYQQLRLQLPVDSFQICKINRLILEHLFPDLFKKIIVREIIDQQISFQQLYRILEIYATDEYVSNKPIKQSIQFALGSTYSPAVGFVYYFIKESAHSFADFMSKALVLTITLFHLTTLLLVWFLMRFRFSPFAALLTGFIFLFSISLYSYSFHLGSTVWNIFTAVVWLCMYAWSQEKGIQSQRTIMSLTTAILFFFNYLIIFYWTAFMLLQLYSWWQEKKNRSLFSFFKLGLSQWVFFISLVVVLCIFYQSTQGNRGNFDSLEELYCVILNFFCIFNQYTWLSILQFSFAIICIVKMSIYLFNHIRKRNKIVDKRSTLTMYFIAFLMVFVFTILTRILGIAASRHILWIAPIFFLCITYSFDGLQIAKLKQFIFLIALIIVGFIGITQRQKQTLNVKDYAWEKRTDIDQYLVHDFIFDAYYPLKEKKKPCSWTDDYATLVKGKKYMFISQTIPFQKYMDSIAPILQKKNLQIEVINNVEKLNHYQFAAYTPVQYVHDRANQIIVTEFLTK